MSVVAGFEMQPSKSNKSDVNLKSDDLSKSILVSLERNIGKSKGDKIVSIASSN